jgi:hypothetical protein
VDAAARNVLGAAAGKSGQGPLGWLYSASGGATSLLTGSLLKTSARKLAGKTDIPVANGQLIDENYRAVAILIDADPHTVMHPTGAS